MKENLTNAEWIELVKFCWEYLNYLSKSTSEEDTYNEAERRLIINIFVISASCRVNAIKHVERAFITKEHVPEEFAGWGALDYFIGSVPITVLSENQDSITATVVEESDCNEEPTQQMILEAKDQLESNTFAQALAEAYDSLFINADVLGMLGKRNYADFLNRDSNHKLQMVADHRNVILSTGEKYQFFGLQLTSQSDKPVVKYYGELKRSTRVFKMLL